MAKVQVKAHAKINFTLDIVGAEGGFHTLRSFVGSLDLHDLIVAKSRKDDKVSVRFYGLDAERIPQRNNALLAGLSFVERFQTKGADVTIYRNIPSGGGLGGSSADCAGVLNALAKLYKVEDFPALKEIADNLGSDTGYMLQGGFSLMQGRGEQVEKLPDTKGRKLYLLLLVPEGGVSAKECYQRYDRGGYDSPSTTDQCVQAFLEGNIDEMGSRLSNALFLPAKQLNEDIEKAYKQLQALSPCGVNMTGSGSVVYALFDSEQMRDYALSRYRGEYIAIKAETV